MSTLGEMATGIAHEINQPLNTLSILFDNMLLAASNEDSLPKSYLEKKTEKIYDNIFRIKNIIDHVRVFSRSQDDAILSLFDLNESIRNAVSMISEQFKHKMIELELSLGKIQGTYGNTYQFEQVMLNLLINSKDAIEEQEERIGKNTCLHVSRNVFSIQNYGAIKKSKSGVRVG
jgi:C4-dicarboxylate-specific signal transduction histidine kinase